MEKLIELLDEYRKQNPREFFGDDGSLVVLTGKDFIELNRLVIISKEYGFIKYLVDNDKIDRHNVKETNYGWEFNYYWTIPNSKRNEEIQVERLIMLLSIQDKPIDLLCNILK